MSEFNVTCVYGFIVAPPIEEEVEEKKPLRVFCSKFHFRLRYARTLTRNVYSFILVIGKTTLRQKPKRQK